MFKLSFLKHSIHFKILLDIPLWKTNTGKKGYSSFGQISPKINPTGCIRIPTHSPLVETNTQVDIGPVLSKEFLGIQATMECKFTLKCTRDMIRAYSQINPSNKNVKQRLLSCMLQTLINLNNYPIIMIDIIINSLISFLTIFSYHHFYPFKSFFMS